ncbi:MAG: UDP-N-acetylmuramyl-tripeptide synthetase [Patescibacteria group bacterium]|jgi:UDP-N-acetylmuramoyl-L-alanyl-D-glutamate--2,6-diaminopimelate ligase
MIHLKKIYWFLKALIANILYGFPSREITLIGVTGTDGKTSTTSMIYHILASLNEKASYITTVHAHVAGTSYPLGFHVTTPSPFFIQKMIRQAVKKGDRFFVLETTSHALDQLRVWGCRYKIAALTNITNEHLDWHKNYTNYARAKMKLVNQAEIGVVNVEPSTYYKYKDYIHNKNMWSTGVEKTADIMYQELVDNGLKDRFVVFEQENATVAYGVCKLLGFDSKKIAHALNSFERVKGRFDLFEKGGVRFMVDFAHTPAAFKQLFSAIKKSVKPLRIIHVFGCAGLRDKSKRLPMGQLSAQNADLSIVTEEDYRTEKIETIFSQIEKGFRKVKDSVKDKTYYFVEDRQEAVNKAVGFARNGDVVVLTGKAHEQSLARGKKEFPWDEYKAVDIALSLKLKA